MKIFRIITICLLFPTLLIAGCAKKEKPTLSEKQMYERAFSALDKGRYETAVERYQELSATYPYGRFTTQGELEICYAYYKIRDSDQALPCIDSFLSLHPTHPHIDYAYYLKGLAALPVRPPKIGESLFKSQEQFSDHDAESAREAYAAFSEVVDRFPLSEYAESSRQILVDLINTFARHDLRVARYYLYRKAYVGAVSRAKSVLERYEVSPYSEEALAILIFAYNQMGLNDLAEENRRVLNYNFPSSRFMNNEHIVLDQEYLDRNTNPLLFGLFR